MPIPPEAPPSPPESAAALVPAQAAPVEPPRVPPLAGIDVTPGAPGSRRAAYWSIDACGWVSAEGC